MGKHSYFGVDLSHLRSTAGKIAASNSATHRRQMTFSVDHQLKFCSRAPFEDCIQNLSHVKKKMCTTNESHILQHFSNSRIISGWSFGYFLLKPNNFFLAVTFDYYCLKQLVTSVCLLISKCNNMESSCF